MSGQTRRLRIDDLLRSPVSFCALGFGSGLSAVAPGTVGTLPGVLICLLLATAGTGVYVVVTLLVCGSGLWICQSASDELGVHDHGGIVWDEIAGFLVTMLMVPVTPLTLVLGFALFRLLDISKPWPIGWIDRNLDGGKGIMADDIAAGAICCALLHVLVMLFPGWLLTG